MPSSRGPALLFADEPTGNLDYTTGTEILDALWRSCHERGQTIVLVTHDSKAAAYADRVLVIGDGRIRDTIELGRRADHDATALIARLARARPLTGMRGLHGLAWRGLRARPMRTTPHDGGRRPRRRRPVAGLATNAGIDAAVDRAVATLVGRADLRVAAFGEAGLSAATLAAIEGTPGVAVAAPAFERRTYLGTGLLGPGPLPAPVTVVGIDPAAEAAVHDLTLATGAPLGSPDEPVALVTSTLAAEDGLTVGSRLGLQGVDAPVDLRSSASSPATGRGVARPDAP